LGKNFRKRRGDFFDSHCSVLSVRQYVRSAILATAWLLVLTFYFSRSACAVTFAILDIHPYLTH